MDAVELLDKVLADDWNWIQFRSADYNGGRCMLGRVEQVLGRFWFNDSEGRRVVFAAADVIREQYPRVEPYSTGPFWDKCDTNVQQVVGFNDTRGRTKEDCVAVFEKTRARLAEGQFTGENADAG